MTILQITSHLNVGGVASHVLAIARGLTARGHRTIIASGGGQLVPQAQAAGAAHWDAPLRTSAEFSPQVFAAGRALARRLRAEPVQLIHAHTRVAHVVADRLARRAGIPYVTTWHGFFRPNLGRRLWPCTGARTIAISEPVRQHLARDFGLPEERIRLIPHGIDPAPFEAPVEPSQQQQLRGQAGLPADRAPVIGTIARLVASKHVDELIRVLPEVRRAVPGTRLLIVGDGEERGRLAQFAGTLGVQEAVHFAGTLAQTRVALSLMQVFVFLPADQEGFGLSLLEAMASGRPIVAVRRGGGSTWLLDRAQAGRLVPPGDFPALAEAIVQLLLDGDAARQAAVAARAIIREQFSVERMVDQVEAVYREVAG